MIVGKGILFKCHFIHRQANTCMHTHKYIHTYKHIYLCGKTFLTSLPIDYWYYGEWGIEFPMCVYLLSGHFLYNKILVSFVVFICQKDHIYE